jgi:hypothetical protein
MPLIAYKDASNQEREMIDVYLGRKRVGRIWKEDGGYRYYPTRSTTGGDLFKTLPECKRSLEAE